MTATILPVHAVSDAMFDLETVVWFSLLGLVLSLAAITATGSAAGFMITIG